MIDIKNYTKNIKDFYTKLNILPTKDSITILKEMLEPNETLVSIEEINIMQLYNNGYRTFILDIDNTLITEDQRTLTLQKLNWISQTKSFGFNIFLVSNNLNFKKYKKLCIQAEVKGLYFALKPLVFSVKQLAKENEIDLKKTVFVGDKLLTDILMGNWLKGHTILVEPMDKKNSFIKTTYKEIEAFLLKKLKDM
jgi:uncharacterized protein